MEKVMEWVEGLEGALSQSAEVYNWHRASVASSPGLTTCCAQRCSALEMTVRQWQTVGANFVSHRHWWLIHSPLPSPWKVLDFCRDPSIFCRV